MPPLRLAAISVAAFLALAAPASAGDPIMPLAQVQAGMRCTGLSVIHGTDPAAFDVEVLEVVTGDPTYTDPRILIGVSGPAVDRTGLGPGFSGSPVYCRDAAGVSRVIGAISESIGEYGGKVVLATPIELILAVRTRAPAPRGRPGRASSSAHATWSGHPRAASSWGTSRARAMSVSAATRRDIGPRTASALARGDIRPLTAPLAVSGLSGPISRALTQAARRAGRAIVAAPARPAVDYPVQRLRPGSAMAAGLSSGDLAIGALGTVAYVDGSRVWSFGHGMDNAGARALLLQDSYVFHVVNNPVPGGEVSATYKLAVPGHPVGTVSNDEVSAVAGTLGGLPATIPVTVTAIDGDTRARRVSRTQVADETGVDNPSGASIVSLVAPLAVTQTTSDVLGSAPGKLAGSMCARLVIREVDDPLRICNRYVSMGAAGGILGFGNAVADRAGADIAEALGAVDAYKFDRLHVREVSARITVHRGIRQAYLRSVTAPRHVRPGQRVRLRVVVERVLGPRRTLRLRARIPQDAMPGRTRLVLTGTPADEGSELFEGLFDFEVGTGEAQPDDPGPRTLDAVVRRIRRVQRYDGVRMALGRAASDDAGDMSEALGFGERRRDASVRVYRDPEWRISGRVATTVRVMTPGRRGG